MRIQLNGREYLLSYSTNVHPGETLEEVLDILKREVRGVRELACPDREFGVELRLGHTAARDLAAPAARERLRRVLGENGLFLFSINAFPLRDFHADRVKEQVYRPDWGEPERWLDTLQLCELLAEFLPPGLVGTISTLPGSFKPWGDHPALRAHIARGFAPVLHGLDRIHREQGRLLLLALEPEPLCTCETVRELVDFLEDELATHAVRAMVDDHGMDEAAAHVALRRHLGINLDTCHLAVEFEDPEQAVEELARARVPVAKLHLAAAARVRDPARNQAGMRALERLQEPRYLHQTFGIDRRGRVTMRQPDLDRFLAFSTSALEELAEVRTHFHLPLTAPADAPLGATTDITARLLDLLQGMGGPCHLVTETYTWPLLGAGEELHANIAAELEWVRARLRERPAAGETG